MSVFIPGSRSALGHDAATTCRSVLEGAALLLREKMMEMYPQESLNRIAFKRKGEGTVSALFQIYCKWTKEGYLFGIQLAIEPCVIPTDQL